MLNKKSFIFLLNLLRSIAMYISWIIFQPMFTLLAYPLTFLPEKIRYDNRLYFFITKYMATMVIRPSFLTINIYGRENLPAYPEQPSIFIANHTSAFDIPLLDMLLGSYPHVWMSKEFYGKVPFFGRLVRVMHVVVQRDNPRKALQALIQAIDRVQGHSRHLLIFPEGTRHADGKLHEFHQGFAIAAEKLLYPVIPIAVSGFHTAFPKGSFICQSVGNPITIHIGKPLTMSPGESRQEFTQRVHAWYEQTLTLQ